MKRIALTGGIATGKSVVRSEFERLGVPTVDADLLARAAVAPGTPALVAILARFGSEILDDRHELDRSKLGAIVFADESSRRDLERIVHPAVQAAVNTWLAATEREGHRLAMVTE